MSSVLDTSVAMAWCFEDEVTPYTELVLERLEGDTAMAPAIWPLEVANVLCDAERRQRLQPADSARFADLLRALPITVNDVPIDRATGAILDLARTYGLSAYDASYLELAMREGLALATQDTRLADAAARSGVLLVQ